MNALASLTMAISLALPMHALADAPNEITIGPDYADAPELTVSNDAPKGTVHEFVMDSKDSKIYKGIVPKVLDNLIHQKRVPAMIAIMIDSGGGD